MKQSLWDLKRVVKLCQHFSLLHFEAVPMGFETVNWVRKQKKVLHFEAVPMGFETKNCHRRRDYWYHFEAVPMGFETTLKKNIKSFLINFEAVPMGFETNIPLKYEIHKKILKQSLWDLKQKIPIFVEKSIAVILKQSLWDLKPRHIAGAATTDAF